MDALRDEQFDELGLETPFSGSLTGETDREGPLNFGEETFVTLPSSELQSASSLESAISEAESEAAQSSEAEWLEAEWLETPSAAAAESLESYCERLGRQWSERRKGDPSPEALRAWLMEDHEATQLGAQQRWKKLSGSADFASRVTRAWMISREEQMHFQTDPGAGVKPLGPFNPPAAKVELIAEGLIEGSDKAPVAPLTARFARQLKRTFPGVQMSNYRGHGGGPFLNRGYSLDLFLEGRDERGFYKPEQVKKLLRAVSSAARSVGAGWRCLYNDFQVADAINREFGHRHVLFIGAVSRDRSKRVTGLNWHGPNPLILHVHLDLAPVAGAELGESEHSDVGEAEVHLCAACEKGRADGFAFHDQAVLEEVRDPFESRGEALEQRGEEPHAEAFEQESKELAEAGLSPAERRALEITSTLETGKAGGFYGLSGNFDGQGLSFGLVNWTIGTGSLQPLLRDFAHEEPSRWKAVFGRDADRFEALIARKGREAEREQLRFAVEEMNEKALVRGHVRWAIREPWRTYFKRLSEEPAFRQIQLRYVRNLLGRAAYFCRLFALKSERAFAFMFDAVSSHGKWWLTRKFPGGAQKRRLLLEERLRPFGGIGHGPEREVLLIIADVLAETSAPRWADNVRSRKRWFVTGEHRRARELAGLEPSADRPWTLSAGTIVHEEGEELAWLDFEGGPQMEEFSSEYHEGEAPWPGEAENWAAEAESQFESEGGFGSETAFGSEAALGELGFESGFGSESLEQGEEEWRPSEAMVEALLAAPQSESLDYEESEAPAQACRDYPDSYRKLIRRRNTPGEVLNRTQGNPSTDLTLQFSDYDVNAYLAGEKAKHAANVGTITDFIRRRLAQGSSVDVTITGSASHTGTREYNQELSDKRADCMARMIRASLTSSELARIRFDTHGEGFDKSKCEGSQCELPGYRSVLVSVHAPNRPPTPIKPEPPGFDKFSIRCCSFHSKKIEEVALDALLRKLPEGMPRWAAEKIEPILRKRGAEVLSKLLKRLPKLAQLSGDVKKLLKFLPVEITRQTAVFQIRERRDVPNPEQITLCYSGWGGRLALPLPGKLDDALDELLPPLPKFAPRVMVEAREQLKRLMKDELKNLLPGRVASLLGKLDSNTPGPWKPFELNRRQRLAVFLGRAEIFIDIISDIQEPGQITLGFDSRPWTMPDKQQRTILRCQRGCAESVIQLQIAGGGFDLLSVNVGDLESKGCACTTEAQSEAFEPEAFEFA